MLTEKEQVFLDELYRRYSLRLQLFCFEIFDRKWEYWQLAEDCVQQTFEKAMIKIHRLLKHEKPYLWLRKTCHNIAISERRKLYNRDRILRYPFSTTEKIQVADPKDDITDWIIKEDLLERAEELFALLTEQEQMVYDLIYNQDNTITQAANKMSVTSGAVRGALQRIRKKITKILPGFIALFIVHNSLLAQFINKGGYYHVF